MNGLKKYFNEIEILQIDLINIKLKIKALNLKIKDLNFKIERQPYNSKLKATRKITKSILEDFRSTKKYLAGKIKFREKILQKN
jgi:hypothetical protein